MEQIPLEPAFWTIGWEAMKSSRPIPTLDGFDSSMAFLREGYRFIGNRCDALGSDLFRTRLMLSPVVCMRGPAAAAEFYQAGRFTRQGAMPRTALALLQDRGSVQTLDGAEHRHRKQMFMDLMGDAALARARAIFREEWQAAAAGWQGRTIALHDALRAMLTRTAIRWCGIPPETAGPQKRAAELSAMIDHAGAFGPGYLRARLLRRRSEKWARATLRAVREELLILEPGCPAERFALERDRAGALLSLDVAAVELLNLLRPIVAVGRFITFAAHALHVHAAGSGHLTPDAPQDAVRCFIQEVRRFYPFFPAIAGRARESFAWRGHRFELGDWVLLDIYGTNRHPDAWREPETFDPERFHGWPGDPYTLVAQGGGSYLKGHRCPGEWLTIALMEEATRLLTTLDYAVPAQDLAIPLDRFPTGVPGSFLMEVRGGGT